MPHAGLRLLQRVVQLRPQGLRLQDRRRQQAYRMIRLKIISVDTITVFPPLRLFGEAFGHRSALFKMACFDFREAL